MANPRSPRFRPGGTRLHLPSTTTATTSTRGKALTALEEDALREICLARKQGASFANHPKSFWLQISDLFVEVSGRQYSWQSCRRRMLAWEELDKTSHPPVSSSSMAHFEKSSQVGSPTPTAFTGGFQSNTPPSPCDMAATPSSDMNGHGTEDDLLPNTPVPLLRRAPTNTNTTHQMCQLELAAARGELCHVIKGGLDAFESQLQLFANVLLDKVEDRNEIYRAFDELRNEVDKGIEKYKRANS